MCVLSYLKAKGYIVFVITDDKGVMWLAKSLGCGQTNIEVLPHLQFDLFICCHGNKIIDKKYLVEGRMINIHPALHLYRGKNPIKKFIFNQDTEGSVESQWLIEEVDAGEVIHQEKFETPVCKNYADYYNVALKHYFFCIDKTLEILGV